MKKKAIPKGFEHVYNRTTCQKCHEPIPKKRVLDCKKRRFWPVCEECEKKVIPIYKKAVEMLAKKQADWFK
jgi:NAD-dependent SIR2 family protein deacetylase